MAAYTGALLASAAMAPNPPPVRRHGEMKRPDDAWSPEPAGTGSGYPGAEEVVPVMSAPGLMQEFGRQWGHGGTHKTRAARRPFFVGKGLAVSTSAQFLNELGASQAAADAHKDKTSAYFPGHVYTPVSAPFMGEVYSVDTGAGDAGDAVAISGRVITKTRPGGRFSDGPLDAMYKPTGFRRGYDRRFAIAKYSSPTLGAMYSKNTLRGVLPQIVAVPVNQPAQHGITDSGMSSQQRFPRVQFTTPQLFRTPPSVSDTMIAAKSYDMTAPVIGIGF